MTMEKLVKINGKCAKASIRISSSLNAMSMNYIEKKGLTWKYLNTDDKIVGYISGIEVDVDGVKVMQKFYVERELSCDIVPWIVKTRCNIWWKNGMKVVTENDNGKENNLVDVRRLINKKRNFRSNISYVKTCDHNYDNENLETEDDDEIDTCETLYQHRMIVELGLKYM
ncbi:38094_t:CDS:2, partial [Gigaspora margarita]